MQSSKCEQMEQLRLRRIVTKDFEKLVELQKAYKKAIGEEQPDEMSFARLKSAIADAQIVMLKCIKHLDLRFHWGICWHMIEK